MQQSSQVILASGNSGKLKEFKAAFSQLNIALIPQPQSSEYNVAETGTTFIENAIIKARHASKLSGLPALADDSGLIVPALQGQPGVHSARYAGEKANDSENLDLLLHNMQGIGNREAHFYCCLAFMRHPLDPDPIIAKGLWFGEITTEAKGESGFGYDPIFWVHEQQSTAAEMPKEIKQKLSHRAQAIKQLTQEFMRLGF